MLCKKVYIILCIYSVQSGALHVCVPYSGKLSREKTFAFFAVSEPSVNDFSAKFCGHTYIIIGRTGAMRESFLREILVL